MTPYYQDDQVVVHFGDCLDVLKTLPDNSVDAVVTDPPYGLEFMGKDWDSFARQDTTAAIQRGNAGGFGDRPGKPWNKARSGTRGVKSTFRCLNCGGWSGTFSAARAERQRKCDCIEPRFDYAGAPASMLAFQSWCTAWATECLRVLKPGGHLLAFGGTRTAHRLACAIEDAGFEIRDSIAWLYGSGFPKSLDVSKAIDKAAGAEREVVGRRENYSYGYQKSGKRWDLSEGDITAPATDAAKQWAGYGTALKPSHEPIIVARKPLQGSVASNVLKHGTGGLNIDACRVRTTEALQGSTVRDDIRGGAYGSGHKPNPGDIEAYTQHSGGRWPPNVALDRETADELDKRSGYTRDGVAVNRNRDQRKPSTVNYANHDGIDHGYGGFGGASRFFPVFETPPAGARYAASCGDCGGDNFFSTQEARQAWLREHNPKHIDTVSFFRCHDQAGFPTFRYTAKAATAERPSADGVSHPTVKPLELMRWLVRLVTPPGGTVLDPFAGTGTTGEAAIHEHKHAVLIEREPSYLPLIVARLSKPMHVGFNFDEEPA